jgi:hypothetical protein
VISISYVVVDELLAADVDDDAVDRSTAEREAGPRSVVAADRGAGIPANREAVAGEREPARLGLDLGGADRLVVDGERQRAEGTLRAGVFSGLLELRRE